MSADFQALVDHYRATRRDLPWRRSCQLYPVLVSELMLQQTRVETVVPYYLRFMERFPDPASLAQASEDEVLAAWAGLGYYRRARMLQEAARCLMERQPATFEELRALPGVGDYTAAALWSICYGQPAVALDGNAIRVLSRYHASSRSLAELTLPDIPAGTAGDFTQAVMELGATFCLPRNPRCLLCPLRGGCQAHGQGRVAEFPPPKRARAQVEVRRLVARVEDAGRTLLVRDSQAPILARMWQCPYWEYEDEPPYARLRGPLRELGEVRHGITYRKLRMQVVQAAGLEAPLPWSEARWVPLDDLGGLPVPAFVKKIYLMTTS